MKTDLKHDHVLEPPKRSGHPGDHMWSTDENASVLEGTSAESPVMNANPDAGGGSVSLFTKLMINQSVLHIRAAMR
jgi:hypothetical protein